MNEAADYLARVRSLILINARILHWQIVREEAQGNVGLFRYRLTLNNHELFELFEMNQSQVKVLKYSFHWQREDGQLIKLWIMQHIIQSFQRIPTTCMTVTK